MIFSQVFMTVERIVGALRREEWIINFYKERNMWNFHRQESYLLDLINGNPCGTIVLQSLRDDSSGRIKYVVLDGISRLNLLKSIFVENKSLVIENVPINILLNSREMIRLNNSSTDLELMEKVWKYSERLFRVAHPVISWCGDGGIDLRDRLNK